MEYLHSVFDKLLRETSSTFHRYLYDEIDWGSRMIGIMGPRGVGKTTMLLQYIKEHLSRKDTLYVVAEDLYFSSHTLIELADQFTKIGGRHLFIDEIHKYKDWSRELKLIYDYHAELQVVFTGSSVLDISSGVSDLSRRVLAYTMQGLSYREYLQLRHKISLPKYSIKQILQQEVTIPDGFLPLEHFSDYLHRGYYPYLHDDHYATYVQAGINATLEIDIPQYYDLSVSMMRKLKRLLGIIAQSAPFKPNMTQIGGQIGMSRNNISDLCELMQRAGLIGLLRDSTNGIMSLGKLEKVYLDNTTLIYAIGNPMVEIGTVRETFFFNQLRTVSNITASPVSDFLVDKTYTFEVGGKHKKQKQIQGIDNAFVVKDDSETGYGNIIPLWQFGLLY